MKWLRRLFGAKQPSEPKSVKGPGNLQTVGERAGGTGDLTAVEQTLGQAGFRLHDAGREFLREHHGLALDVPIAGVEGINGFVLFAPKMALRLLGPQDRPRLVGLMPETACPIGTTSGHTIFVFMDDQGKSYLLDMEWSLFAELAVTPTEMVQVLCDGRNGRVDSHVLDQQGRPTGQMLREGDERSLWHVDQFPFTAPYLPPASLSPGRRPPTWRAMVRAAEQGLAQGSSPQSLLLTCGGFTTSPSGQMYFVAHCENSLYVRSKGGFLVSTPPPGIAEGFRMGEVIPFQRPPNW